MSRQRLQSIYNKKHGVERFDIITLTFLIYSEYDDRLSTEERFNKFVNKTNELLVKCHMQELYAVNPYEAFVLMCMLTEEPLSSYTEVWELSADSVTNTDLHN